MLEICVLTAIYTVTDLVAEFIVCKTGIVSKINEEIDKELDEIEKELDIK